jgi:flavin reductase (DIM6/NTAB) family NADH-FMN oxidoreductase RutF
MQIVDVGPGTDGSGHVVIGKILCMHIAERIYKDGHILIDELKPVARLAGPTFCPVREIFTIPRPKI